MQNAKIKNFCQDCGRPSVCHIQTWLDELLNRFLPRMVLPRKIEQFFDACLEGFFIFFGFAKLRDDFTNSDILLRSFCLIEELRKRGARVQALRGLAGYTNCFRVEINGKVVRFEKLPIADFVGKSDMRIIDDKEKTKTRLRKGNFPVADGKAFWFLQKKKALTYGMEKLGIPLTVKPRGGSFSRHVTCNINSSRELENAIDKAIKYSPSFIIERFLKDISVFRATVVDFDFIACCERIPANVVGDGEHSIKQLIKIKNTHAFRKNSKGKDTPLCKIIADKTTDELLKNKDYNLTTIPFKKEIVWLQKDPFWRLGADVIESTEKAHPDNLKLFKDVAKAFDTRLVGIDFLVKNISVSWKNQVSAIIELNSLPCIELHHFPSLGPPQNAAKAVADLFFKYYL